MLCINLESTENPRSPLQLWTAFQALIHREGPWELYSVPSHPLLIAQQKHIHFHRHPEQTWQCSLFASSGACRKLYAKADNVMKNKFVQKTTAINYYCYYSIDLFQCNFMIGVLTGKDHSMDPKFSWQSLISSNIQHKTSLVSCQFNQLSLDKWELPESESESVRPTNHVLTGLDIPWHLPVGSLFLLDSRSSRVLWGFSF